MNWLNGGIKSGNGLNPGAKSETSPDEDGIDRRPVLTFIEPPSTVKQVQPVQFSILNRG